MFLRTGTVAEARYVVTDRYGGASDPPYDELNLGGHVGDESEAVETNRARVAAEIRLPWERLVFMRQVHGADAAVVGEPWPDGDGPEVDAVVTRERGLALAVLVADCTPVVLASRRSHVIAVAHAGRPGLVAGVVPAAVSAMQKEGARPSRIVAHLGPAICGRCYEVPPDLQEQVCDVVPAARSTTSAGTTGLDIRAGIVAQLLAAGVETIEVEAWCTAERTDLYSHRRDGVTGRFAAVVWLPRP